MTGKTRAITLTTGLLTTVAILAISHIHAYRPPSAPLRVGVWAGPPFEIVLPNGNVTGLGPDVINEAARRVGIQLEWVNPAEGPETMLPDGRLDLWGSMSVTPLRRARFFLTRPWAESYFGLVSLAGSAPDPKTVIGVLNTPVPNFMVRQVRPEATVKTYPDRSHLFDALCAGEVLQIFMDQRSFVAQSMSRSPACVGAAFAVEFLPNTRLEIATGASPGNERHAEAIRNEIDRMAIDGSLGRISSHYAVGLGSTDWLLRLSQSERKQELMWLGIGLLILVASVTVWQGISVRNARTEADRANRAKTEFLATMSHEIRTPMNGVLGLTNLLLETSLNADQRDMGRSIQSSAESLMSILNDILDFSKIESGGLTLESLPFDPIGLTHETADGFAGLAAQKGLALQVIADGVVPRSLVGDPGRLRQVLTNLIGNAIKFTEKGHVRVRWQVRSHTGATVTLFVAVEDSGVGIPAEKQELIFERFRQADTSTTRRFGGTGLGLAISKLLVHAMGGTIGVNSQHGHGSTFWFVVTLPLGPERKADEVRRDALAPISFGRSPRVLVVEDNGVNRKVAERTLQRLGCVVTLAAHGGEALSLLSQATFDLIFMDCLMPVMDGYEATRQIRSMEAGRRRTPIIAMTASVLDEERKLCSDCGMDDFLPKPWRAEQLRDILLHWYGEAAELNGLAPGGTSPTPKQAS